MSHQDWSGGFTRPNGTFVAGRGGTRAFVPNPLPPEWDMAPIHGEYVRAEKAISGLGTAIRVAGVPDTLASLYMRREAVQSSRMEGTPAGLDDLLQHEAGRRIGAGEMERLRIAEVSNCAKAMEGAMAAVEGGGGITVGLIKSAHRALWVGVAGQEKNPGSTRGGQNAIVAEREGGSEVVYVPPPPEMVGHMLDALVKFMDGLHPEIPVIIQCAVAHYQFEAIHPFGDGNGRVGRMLIPLMLARSGTLSRPLLQLGEYMALNKAEYYARLEGVSQRSEWGAWLGLFMRAFAEQAEAATEDVIALARLRARYVEAVSGASRSVARRMVDMLFANPYVTTGQVRKRLGVSQTGAVRGISRLARAGILRRVPARDRTRVWVADEIVDAVRTVEPGQHGARAAVP